VADVFDRLSRNSGLRLNFSIYQAKVTSFLLENGHDIVWDTSLDIQYIEDCINRAFTGIFKNSILGICIL
jgi:hypothetical protein